MSKQNKVIWQSMNFCTFPSSLYMLHSVHVYVRHLCFFLCSIPLDSHSHSHSETVSLGTRPRLTPHSLLLIVNIGIYTVNPHVHRMPHSLQLWWRYWNAVDLWTKRQFYSTGGEHLLRKINFLLVCGVCSRCVAHFLKGSWTNPEL